MDRRAHRTILVLRIGVCRPKIDVGYRRLDIRQHRRARGSLYPSMTSPHPIATACVDGATLALMCGELRANPTERLNGTSRDAST